MNEIPPDLVEYYDYFQSELFDYGKEIEIIDATLKKNHAKTVVDVGCGTGTHLIGLSSIGYDCVGIDNNIEMIKEARQKARAAQGSLKFIKADASDSKSVDAYYGYFDASIWIRNTLPSVGDIERTLETHYDLLRSNGILIFDLLQPDENISEEEMFNMDVVTRQNFCGVQLNSFKLRLPEVRCQCVYFLQLEGGVRMVPRNLVLHLINQDDVVRILTDHGFKYEASIYEYASIPMTKSLMILARKEEKGIE